jgi:hypothetical protein
MPTTMTDNWGIWLRSTREPVVLALGGYWDDPTHSGLDAIRAELRGLEARLVVANSRAAFCVGPEDDAAVPRLDRPGFEALYRTLGADPGDREGENLTLTLVDRAFVRAQSKCEPDLNATDTLQQLLAWARQGVVEIDSAPRQLPDAPSRHECIILMLTGALSLPFVEACRPSSAPPSSQPPPNSDWAASRVPTVERASLHFPWN